MDQSYKLKQTGYIQKIAALVLASSLAAAGTIAILPSNAFAAQAATTSTSSNTSTTQSVIAIQVNGKAIRASAIRSKAGNTLVPLKDTLRAMGYTLSYSSRTQMITATKGKTSATYDLHNPLSSGDDGVYVSFNNGLFGEHYDSKIVKGVAYVQAQALAEPFNYLVLSSHNNRTINLTQAGMNDITVTPTALTSKVSNANASIDITYPVITGLDNTAVQTAINHQLKDYFQQFLTKHQKKIKALGSSVSKENRYDVISGYRMTYNQNGIVSFILSNNQFLGNTQGDVLMASMNFSLRDGKLIPLDDLLTSNANYEQTLKTLIQKEIRKSTDSPNDSLKKFNALSATSNEYMNNYYLTDSGFHIFFQITDITSGMTGNPDFGFTFNQVLPSGTNPLNAYK
ncbi:PdaC/SigV domain-containing protein [Paenibacillus kandeliae]|uniref:PdaC/SigV domain-containing protein n=1 Tax=Paenibacillus kandeliae TaxID=3231269 RepID=UPI0034593041